MRVLCRQRRDHARAIDVERREGLEVRLDAGAAGGIGASNGERDRRHEAAALADFREPGKHFQHPAGDQRHGVGEEQDAGEHEEAAKHLLHGGEMRPEALQAPHEGPDGEGGGDEGDAEAERIDEEQAGCPGAPYPRRRP